MPEVSPQPTKPQVVTKQSGFNWKSVLLAVFIGAVVITAAVAGLFYYLNQNQSSLETGSVVIKKATSSAKKDETADWKTYINTKYKYSFKYPANARAESGVEGDNDFENTASVIVGNSGAIFSLNTYEINGQLSEIEGDYRKDKNNTNFSKINIDGVDGVSFLYYGSTKRVELVNNGILYDFNITDQNTFDQILSTFKFIQ